jgi:L-lactate dehydrogenase complex protein LldG
MTQARKNILSRLKKAQASDRVQHLTAKPSNDDRTIYNKTELLISKLEENHVNVYRVSAESWVESFQQILKQESSRHCLIGQNLSFQDDLITALSESNEQLKVSRFDQPYESLRKTLFHDIDISLTTAEKAIAETGTIVLIPNENEPRTMSLIPPIHVVLLYENQIVDSLSQLISSSPWKNSDRMPTNILFISSPSKTADIQQTLAYGAHGPKKLIVLLAT